LVFFVPYVESAHETKLDAAAQVNPSNRALARVHGVPPRACRDIAPPPEEQPFRSKKGSRPEILPPDEGGSYGKDLESPLQRRQRLEEAGIVEPPPERIPVLSTFEKMADALRPETETPEGDPLPIGLRVDGNFGSWWPLKSPRETRYVPDFSYGFSVLFPFGKPNTQEGTTRAFYFGPGVTFYNGGTYQTVPDSYDGRSDVYADTNVTEAGVDLLYAQETKLSKFTVLSSEMRVTYAPFRQVRAVYSAQKQTPGRSEVGSHTNFNWMGVGVGFGGVLHLARALGAGPFASFSLATPTQVKFRVGLQVVFTSTTPVPSSQAPKQEDSNRPSSILKGTRFDKPLPSIVPVPVPSGELDGTKSTPEKTSSPEKDSLGTVKVNP
jgi:hypothetical protein